MNEVRATTKDQVLLALGFTCGMAIAAIVSACAPCGTLIHDGPPPGTYPVSAQTLENLNLLDAHITIKDARVVVFVESVDGVSTATFERAGPED